MDPKLVEVEGKQFIPVSDDGLPIYVSEGKEIPVNVAELSTNLRNTMAEAKGHRTAKEELEGKFKPFKDLDPKDVSKAMETYRNLSDKELIDAGEAERVKEQALNTVREEMTGLQSENEKLKSRLHSEVVGGLFARSKFIAEKLAVPTEMVQSTFGNRFQMEDDGRVVALDDQGKPLMSRRAENAGQHASFEEAIAMMVDASPFKEAILKGNNNSGGGGEGGGGATDDGRTISRAEFNRMSPRDQGAFVRGGGTVAA